MSLFQWFETANWWASESVRKNWNVIYSVRCYDCNTTGWMTASNPQQSHTNNTQRFFFVRPSEGLVKTSSDLQKKTRRVKQKPKVVVVTVTALVALVVVRVVMKRVWDKTDHLGETSIHVKAITEKGKSARLREMLDLKAVIMKRRQNCRVSADCIAQRQRNQWQQNVWGWVVCRTK